MARSMTQSGPSRTAPRWAGDFGDRNAIVPGGAKLNAAEFFNQDSVLVVVGAAGAAANATTVPVDALTGPIPSGTLLDFGGGGKKFARLSADADTGDTSIATDAIPTALVDNDAARYPGTQERVNVPSGTLIGRTIAERDAETGYGPAVSTDDEIFLTVYDVDDVAHLNDVDLYRHGRMVYEDLLPGWSGLGATLQGVVRDLYLSTVSND